MDESLGPFNLVLLAMPGVALKITVRAMFRRQSLAVMDPMQMLLSQAGTILLVLALVGGAVGLLGAWWMLIPVPLVMGIAVFMAIDRYRHGEHRALLWSLASAARLGIPLAEAARAYADENLGDSGLRAMALARGLEQGLSLSAAILSARLRVATPVLLAIRLGENLGTLGPAMGQQLDDSAEIDGAMRGVLARFFYLGNVAAIGTFVIIFIMLKVMPVFERMFDEFGLKLPAPTVLAVNISKFSVDYGPVLVAPLVLAAGLFFLSGLLFFLGLFPRDLPLVWRVFKRYDGALVLRGLALAVRRGLPLPQGLALVGSAYPIQHIAVELTGVLALVQQGRDWRQALLGAGLISHADAAVLAAAERTGNLAWALEEMCESALRRLVYRVQAALQMIFPAAIAVLGCVVGLFVIAVFLPLIALIQGLS
jgi:type II secretory pathway component PulF